MNIRTLGGLAATVTTLALLAGCSDTDSVGSPPATPGASTAAAPTPAPGAAGAHNGPDATFVQGMIPHHRQAVTMSDLAATRAASGEVKELATRISGAQGPEIDQMNRLLINWGMPPSGPGDMAGMDHSAMGGMGGMGGMMSPEQMRGLETVSGPEFDRAFLRMMIEHHTGAIQMGRTELAQGQNAEAKQLAQSIVDAQSTEIQQMQGLLGRV